MAVLQVLRDATGPLSIGAIAGQVNVHPNTVRFHLSTLLQRGQVEPVETTRRAPGRPPLLFRPTQGMDPAGPRQYHLLADALAEDLTTAPDGATRALEAGRAWGRREAAAYDTGHADTETRTKDPVAPLMGLLDRLGFAPERREQGQIGLRQCPFLEVVGTRAEIVCPVHLGLMKGAVEAWGSPVVVDGLEPFVEPGLCLTHLREGAPS